MDTQSAHQPIQPSYSSTRTQAPQDSPLSTYQDCGWPHTQNWSQNSARLEMLLQIDVEDHLAQRCKDLARKSEVQLEVDIRNRNQQPQTKLSSSILMRQFRRMGLETARELQVEPGESLVREEQTSPRAYFRLKFTLPCEASCLSIRFKQPLTSNLSLPLFERHPGHYGPEQYVRTSRDNQPTCSKAES